VKLHIGAYKLQEAVSEWFVDELTGGTESPCWLLWLTSAGWLLIVW